MVLNLGRCSGAQALSDGRAVEGRPHAFDALREMGGENRTGMWFRWPTFGFVLPVGTRSAPPHSTLALGGQLEGGAVPRRQKAETERMQRQTGLRANGLAALLLMLPPTARPPQLLLPVPSATKIRVQEQHEQLRFRLQAARWLR
jgi:hypothetical protein